MYLKSVIIEFMSKTFYVGKFCRLLAPMDNFANSAKGCIELDTLTGKYLKFIA